MPSPQEKITNSKAIPTDLKPEQALGLVGLGMMQKISQDGTSKLRLVEDDERSFDIHNLRQQY